MIKFSIIIPTYNVEEYINSCINSILKQTFENFELIIVDDCSKDNTINEVNKFKDNRIKLISNSFNKGPAYSRNKAIKHASGDYLVIIDSDDYILENRLEILNQYVEEEKPDLLFDNVCYFYDKKSNAHTNAYKELGVNIRQSMNIGVHEFIEKDLGILKGVIKRDFINKNSLLYNTKFRLAEDFILYLDIFLNKGKVLCIPEALYMYRKRNDSLITTVNEKYYLQLIDATLFVLNKVNTNDLSSKYTKKQLKKRLKKQNLAYKYFLIREYRMQRNYNKLFIVIIKNFVIAPAILMKFFKKR